MTISWTTEIRHLRLEANTTSRSQCGVGAAQEAAKTQNSQWRNLVDHPATALCPCTLCVSTRCGPVGIHVRCNRGIPSASAEATPPRKRLVRQCKSCVRTHTTNTCSNIVHCGTAGAINTISQRRIASSTKFRVLRNAANGQASGRDVPGKRRICAAAYSNNHSCCRNYDVRRACCAQIPTGPLECRKACACFASTNLRRQARHRPTECCMRPQTSQTLDKAKVLNHTRKQMVLAKYRPGRLTRTFCNGPCTTNTGSGNVKTHPHPVHHI